MDRTKSELGKQVPVATGGHCPICRDASDVAYRPFCSKRCSDVDLSRWLRGAYAIPSSAEETDEDGDDAQASRTIVADVKDSPDEDE